MTPADFLFALLIHEAPVITQKPDIESRWKAEIEETTALDQKVGSAGALVSADVDTAMLDAMRWYEARLRQHPKDGDCHIHADKKAPGGVRTVCDAFGPLQIRLTAFRAVLGTPDASAAGISMALLKPVAEDLREPETGVRAGYAGLLRWKGLCGGTPARWLTAWGWGKCPKEKTTIDFEAVRRCELTTVLLVQRGQLPEGWKCGHETRKIRDPHDQHLLKWAMDQVRNEKEDQEAQHGN